MWFDRFPSARPGSNRTATTFGLAIFSFATLFLVPQASADDSNPLAKRPVPIGIGRPMVKPSSEAANRPGTRPYQRPRLDAAVSKPSSEAANRPGTRPDQRPQLLDAAIKRQDQ